MKQEVSTVSTPSLFLIAIAGLSVMAALFVAPEAVAFVASAGLSAIYILLIFGSIVISVLLVTVGGAHLVYAICKRVYRCMQGECCFALNCT